MAGKPLKADQGPMHFAAIQGGPCTVFAALSLGEGDWFWAVAGAVAAACTFGWGLRASRSEMYQARRKLYESLPAAASAGLLHRDNHVLYGIETAPSRNVRWPARLLWLGRRMVTITELDEDQVSRLPAGIGQVHVTGRTYELWPWYADVRVTIRDAALSSDGDDAAFDAQQWFPEEHAGGRRLPFRRRLTRQSRSMTAPEIAELTRKIRDSEVLAG